jgi:hypothetical protein
MLLLVDDEIARYKDMKEYIKNIEGMSGGSSEKHKMEEHGQNLQGCSNGVVQGRGVRQFF